MPTKKRYKVQRGDTYMSVAQTTGVDPVALANANSGISTLSPGFYINVPQNNAYPYNATGANIPTTASNIQGAPPPPTSTATTTIAPAGAQSDYATRQRTMVPQTTTTTSPAPSGGLLGTGVFPIDSPEVSYTLQYLNDPNVALSVSPSIYMTLQENGLTPDMMAELGFVQDTSGFWTRGAGGAPPEPRNAGGWQQSSDGSWHLNRNRAQQERRQERRTQKNEGDGISAAVNWSI